MIESIVFDVDDTMYDQQAPFVKALQQAFPNFQDSNSAQVYLRFRYYSDSGFPRVANQQWTIDEFRFWRIKETLQEFNFPGIDEEQGKLFQQIYIKELERIDLLDEMQLTLDFLTEKSIPIGIITNGPKKHQLRKIENLGLNKYVPSNRIIVSGATNFQKPDKEIFDLAAREFAMNPQTTLYVGDNYHVDVVGANKAGWKSMWFNHRHRQLDDQLKPVFDIEIDSFEQLLGAIKALFDLKIDA
jgi:putative hydrolase of the HAD superfamily